MRILDEERFALRQGLMKAKGQRGRIMDTELAGGAV